MSVNLLLIETSVEYCSVALASDGKQTQYFQAGEKNVHSEKLGIFIQQLLNDSVIDFNNLDGVVVSKGPGSFTGLRIGVALAKGISYALNIPLMAVNTLDSLLLGIPEPELQEHDLLCALIDARNNEVYYSVFDSGLGRAIPLSVGKLPEGNITELLKNNKVLFAGTEVEKWAAPFAKNPNATIKTDIYPDAAYMIPEAFRKYNDKEFEDLSSFEPFYLKDFKVKTSNKLKNILKK